MNTENENEHKKLSIRLHGLPWKFMWVPNRVLKYQVGACVKDCYVGMGGYVPWDVSFTRVLHPFEESEFELLLSLFTNIFISREEVHMHLEALPF